VYAIFEAYCKLKKERRHHDVADRTHAILKTLLGGAPLKGQKVDFLYIDEAQDNLLIDALLLRLICRNPEGLFWAGDTAQTISAGSSFRFDDLKAFLYRIEQDQSMHLIQDRSVTDPTPFQLAINRRSHGGIVNCAHTVIERITRFWPDAIDILQPEHGVVDGLKPVFFRGWDQDTVRYEQSLFGESGSRVEFGAHQCILVRDNEAFEKLYKEVGEVGMIMTIYDSKGLEFNDVFLYNFFEDSPIDATRWRVLLNHAEGEVDGQDLAKVHAPSFGRDEGRFAGLCSELKLLYVGITRARENLLIFDKSEKSEPMRMIWTSRNQVQNCTPGTDVPRLAVSSTPEEWKASGHELFDHKRYPQAMHCFARASRPWMVATCEAFQLREVARAKVGVAPLKVQQDAFLAAADAFVAVALGANDAPPDDAPSVKDKLQYYRNAADCYMRAGDDRKAADAYLDAHEYDLAARRFRKGGLFDKMLEVLDKHSQKIPSESSEELYTVCRLFYCSNRDVKRPRPLFPSCEEELKFLETHSLDLAQAELLENLGRYLEAAQLHLSKNRPLNAIRVFLRKGSRDAIQGATKIVLDGLWPKCSFGVPSRKVADDQGVADLLKLAGEFPVDFLDPLDQHEISMFRAIARADLASLERLANVFLEHDRKAAALLALDHSFRRLPVLRSYKLQDMSLFLDKFLKYARLLHGIICHADPLSSKSIKRLFCITETSNTEYRIGLRSFLHRAATADRQAPMYLQRFIVALSKREMMMALRKYLTVHLREWVTEENELCCNVVVFTQCLTFIVNDQCGRSNCPQEYVKSTDLDAERYNLRIGVHIQHISILQLMYSVDSHLPKQRKHTLTSSLFMNLSVFCDCLEHIVGKASILWCLSFNPPLDGLVLPRGWLSSNKDLSMKNGIRTGLLVDVLNSVQELLKSLLSNWEAASKIYSLSSKPTPMLCNGFTSRICRALCFLSYNVRIADVRNKVKSIFFVLGTTGTTRRLYREYADARDNEYLKVMVKYDADAKVVIEDLVQLLHKQGNSYRAPPLRFPQIQNIYYANPSEIPSLLAVPEDKVHEEAQELAKKIQAAYRMYRKHHEAQARAVGKGSEAQRIAVYVACLRNVHASKWRKNSYRNLYLKALPYLVVCLDKVISIAHEFKKKTKGLLAKGDHERLEELGKQMSNISALIKDGHKLRKMIEPNATMYREKERTAMRKAVVDVKFSHQLPTFPNLAPEIQEDFQVDLVMIEPVSKPKKPTLNTEDL
jgi:hypothetical protein